MKNHMTPSRIANSIQQDSDFLGYNILVEGETDIKLYKKLACQNISKLKVTFGKEKMRDTYNILSERGFTRVIGIRDADFIRLNDNGKYDPEYSLNIFITDSHDSEGMIIQSQAFDDFLLEVSNEDNIINFNKKYGCVREHLYKLSYPLSCLRFANKKYDLGLAFKPVRPEGNQLKFKKFICDKTLTYLGHEKLINTVIEYSKNRGSDIKDRDFILTKLASVIELGLDENEMTNGHDLAEILFILCKKGLKSSNEGLKGGSSVESMLRLSYNKEYFALTELYKRLNQWQENNEVNIFTLFANVA
ncbi:hypothetical protein CTM83_00265 [Photobacterium leiognathi subsp. mandapamensis]|nr:hypothetical protein CTM83_00265 [Photobacterium leiognathi subsp. mandapamensis]GAA06607.1 hypothetical protein PMSV_2764 [Photobacterium leiognathi subsp. mandapamensis svers.1.1.]